MNTQKYGMSNCGLLSEADRTMYKRIDTVSKSCIDKTRTADNYNLCPHPQYTASKIKGMHEKIRGKKMRKDGVAFGSTIISLPRDYTGDTKEFFATAYEGLKRLYKLRDEDIISAYVHMDETTPHMHFYFLPVVHEDTKDRVSWETVMPRKMYQTQHKTLQKYMSDQLGMQVIFLNGETKGVDMTHMTAEEKRLSMRQEQLQKSVGNLRRRETAAVNAVSALDKQIAEKKEEIGEVGKALERLQNAIQHLLQQIMSLKPKEREKEKDLFAWLEKNGKVMGKDLGAINKAADYIEQQSSRLESEYLSIEDDDDFELC